MSILLSQGERNYITRICFPKSKLDRSILKARIFDIINSKKKNRLRIMRPKNESAKDFYSIDIVTMSSSNKGKSVNSVIVKNHKLRRLLSISENTGKEISCNIKTNFKHCSPLFKQCLRSIHSFADDQANFLPDISHRHKYIKLKEGCESSNPIRREQIGFIHKSSKESTSTNIEDSYNDKSRRQSLNFDEDTKPEPKRLFKKIHIRIPYPISDKSKFIEAE